MAAHAEKKLLPAYLVVGEDSLKQEAVVARLKARLFGSGDPSFDYDVIDGKLAADGCVAVSCNTLPMLNPARVVELRNTADLSKEEAESVISYLKAPSETTVLLLRCTKLAKNTRLYKAVAALRKDAVISCELPKNAELCARVRSLAQAKGLAMGTEAANALVELVGEDLVRIDTELTKLSFSVPAGQTLSASAVREAIARTNEVKPWVYLDALCAANAVLALRELAHMPSQSALGLVALVAGRLRELICARALLDEGRSAQLASELKKQSWQVKNHAAWARKFTAAELRHAYSALCDLERALKTGAAATGELQQFTAQFCTHQF